MSCAELYKTVKFGSIKTADKERYVPISSIVDPPHTTPPTPRKSSPLATTWSSLLKSKRILTDRGLINQGNMCFINAILQPLVHIDMFHDLFNQEFTESQHLLCNLQSFLAMFNSENREPIDCYFIYDSIRKRSKLETLKGTQEDAQEFLGFMLDGVHQELLQNTIENEHDKWHDVGKNNKKLVQVVKPSPLVNLVGGRLRSVMQIRGKKTISFEPFQILQLPIIANHINSILDAIIEITRIEKIEGTAASNLY